MVCLGNFSGKSFHRQRNCHINHFGFEFVLGLMDLIPYADIGLFNHQSALQACTFDELSFFPFPLGYDFCLDSFVMGFTFFEAVLGFIYF